MLQAEREDPASNKWKYKLYEETFRISKVTDFKSFHKSVCEYWGLDPSKYSEFYDDNGELIDFDAIGNDNPTLSKIIETLEKNEVKYKDLAPPGPRRAVLYLGDKKF